MDDPLIVQYFDYLGDVATLDLGETITDNREVTDVIVESGGATLTLTLAALLVAIGLGLPLGLLAGRYRDTALDGSLRVFGILTYAAPVFFVGLLAQLTFGSILGWLPTSGEADPITFVPEVTHILLIDALIAGDTAAFRDALLHLILPAVTLGLLVTGVFLRLTRVNVMQALKGDYIEAARARGIGERSVVIRHAFRNALVPVITVMGLQVALLLSGAVLTEVTFDWPGLGSELLVYLNERDYIAVQGIITIFALVVVVVSIADRPRHRHDRPEGAVLMASASGLETPEPADDPVQYGELGRGRGPRLSRTARALKPFRDAQGLSKWLLWTGVILTLAFVLVAVFAPWLAPYDFNQVSTADGGRFPKQAPPSAEHWFGTSVRSEDVLSRVIYGARIAVEVVTIAVIVVAGRRGAARTDLRLLRWLARPGAGADLRRAVRVPLPAARPRDRVPARPTRSAAVSSRQRWRSRSSTCRSTSGWCATARCRPARRPTSRPPVRWAPDRARSSASTSSATSSRACRSSPP